MMNHVFALKTMQIKYYTNCKYIVRNFYNPIIEFVNKECYTV